MADTDLQQTPYPARTKRAAAIVGGIHTDATVIGFADKIVVTVVQEGRLAQWFNVPLDAAHRFRSEFATADDTEDPLLPMTHLTPTTLLGGADENREAAGQLVAVQLASAISSRDKEEARTVLVGLGLKMAELDQMSFMELIELVGRCL